MRVVENIVVKLLVILFGIFSFNLSYAYSSIYAEESIMENKKSINQCFKEASKIYDVPEKVLRAIARVESNKRKYTINVNGKAYYLKSKEKALEVIMENKRKSFDIGIMQINKFWFKRYNYDYELGLDPCWNINMGAYILAYETKRANGNVIKAIARYHSPKKKHQERYLKKIAIAMQDYK